MDEQLGAWRPDDLISVAETRELEIASSPTGRWVPVWVVVDAGRVYVRTWQRRTTGWYGRVAASGRAFIRVAGLPLEVVATATGAGDAEAVDDAYRGKYGTGGAASMITAEAAASTLLLTPTGKRA